MLYPFSRFFHRKPSLRPVLPSAGAVRKDPVPDPPEAFDGPWQMLSGEPAGPAPDARPQAEQDLIDSLAEQVLEHFSRNHPAPTSFPALALQIIDLLNDPDADLGRVLKAISPDPAISLHILKVANSALYGRGADVQDMRTAVMRIGVRGVGEIAAGVAGRSLFDLGLKVEYQVFRERWHRLFLDTMAVAFGASQFAFEQHVGRPDRVFQAGMFHDIGKSLALRSLAALIIAGKVGQDLPPRVVEEVLERVHVETGCVLHQVCALPAHMAELCRDHHLAEVPDDLDHMELHLLRMVSGIHRLVLDPQDTRHLAETRQSLKAMRLVRRGARLLYREMAAQTERVALLFPA